MGGFSQTEIDSKVQEVLDNPDQYVELLKLLEDDSDKKYKEI